MIKKIQITFLVFIPLIFLVIGFKFDRTKYSTDPESAYLMNGLNIATGKAVGHYDNPGTTVQVYSALILRATHFFRNTDNDLQTDVLSNSEFYIEVLRFGLITINAFILLILGLVTFSLLGNFWLAFLLQIAPFTSGNLMEELFTKVAPEPLLFAVVSIMILLLLKFYKSENPGNRKYALLFGLLAGFGLATKMTFLPLLIIPLIVLNGQRNKWIYLVSVLLSFVLFTLPAVKGYPNMAKWFLNLGTHTGTYGQGSSGIIDPAVYFRSIILIIQNNKALAVVLVLAILVLLPALFRKQNLKNKESNREFYLLIAIVLAFTGSILLVAKHYHNNHYLLPALSLSGFSIVCTFLLIRSYANEKKRKVFKAALPLTVAVIAGVSILNIPFLTQAYNGYRDSNQSTDETFAKLSREYKDYVKVYYYPGSFNVYSSLRWGNVYARQYSTEKLSDLYPDGLFYNAWEKSFQFWETSISVKEFLRIYGGKILLVGGPLTEEEFKNVEKDGLKLTKLFDSRIQAVFRIDTAQSSLFTQNVFNKPSDWLMQSDFELVSSDGQWGLFKTGEKFCRNSAFTAEKSRSGKYAIKLENSDSYGMDYELQDVKPGDFYELSIWRIGKNKEGFLVARNGTSGSFYEQNKGYLETDEKGWSKVTLNIKIPAGFAGNKLKIYLWNHGEGPVWFDDFEITKYSSHK